MDSDWKSYHFSYKDSPFLLDNVIEKAKITLDPVKFAREYEASFDESGTTVFYCFDRKTHVTSDIDKLQPGETVHACIDFNIGKHTSADVKPSEFRETPNVKTRATLSEARKGTCNDYPQGVHSSEWKRWDVALAA